MGSIFISYFWANFKGIDLTREGTGQLGGSNAGRVLGWPAMILSGLTDIIKATIALGIIWFILKYSLDSPYYEVALFIGCCGILLGHISSFWIWIITHEWHGGKGAAPLGGIILFLSWESFIWLYIVLMSLLQIGKKLFIKGISIYENFFVNVVLFLCIPFVVFWFTGNFLYFALILLLEGIIAYSEREQVRSILSVVISKV